MLGVLGESPGSLQAELACEYSESLPSEVKLEIGRDW